MRKWSLHRKLTPYELSIYRFPLVANGTFPTVCILAEAPKVKTISNKYCLPQSSRDLLDNKAHYKVAKLIFYFQTMEKETNPCSQKSRATRKEDEGCFGVLITAYFLIWDLRLGIPKQSLCKGIPKNRGHLALLLSLWESLPWVLEGSRTQLTETTACHTHRSFLKAGACQKLPQKAGKDRGNRGGNLPVLRTVNHEWMSPHGSMDIMECILKYVERIHSISRVACQSRGSLAVPGWRCNHRDRSWGGKRKVHPKRSAKECITHMGTDTAQKSQSG